jgi:hypothetical protein
MELVLELNDLITDYGTLQRSVPDISVKLQCLTIAASWKKNMLQSSILAVLKFQNFIFLCVNLLIRKFWGIGCRLSDLK